MTHKFHNTNDRNESQLFANDGNNHQYASQHNDLLIDSQVDSSDFIAERKAADA
jgi:hypothetical protein